MKNKITLQFSKNLRVYLEAQKKACPMKKPIAAIMFAAVEEYEEKVVVGFYDMNRLLKNSMFEVFCSDGMEFLVPQEHVRKALDGKTLDVHNDKIFVK